MYKQKAGITFPTWLRWLCGIIGLFFVVCISLGIYVYQTVENARTADFGKVKQDVFDKTSITTIDNIQRYHGEQAYYAIYGKADDEDLIVFYPFNRNKADIITVDAADVVPEQNITASLQHDCSSCSMIDVAAGVINDDEAKPVWELTYEDTEGQYVLAYFSMYDGTKIKQRRYKRTFEGA